MHRIEYLALGALLLVPGCVKSDPITQPYVDRFERAEIGPDYLNTGGPYRIVDGKLNVKEALNKPLWLKKQIPADADVELDVMSKSVDGDIKVEIWGDGESFATSQGAYLATSYVFIMGGWGNKLSVLARMDEHGSDRKVRQDFRVTPGQTYRLAISRRDGHIDWKVDGKPFLSMVDPAPLSGPRHAYLGFNNWRSDLYFDNLKITPR